MAHNGFTRQYAIQKPDGTLLSFQPPHRQPQGWDWNAYFTAPDYARYMLGEPTPPPEPVPVVFTNPADAEEALKQLAAQAASMGVTYYGGCIVERICSPFTSSNAATLFAADVDQWLRQQGEPA